MDVAGIGKNCGLNDAVCNRTQDDMSCLNDPCGASWGHPATLLLLKLKLTK